MIFRYPKPGTKNPTITLKVADLADPKNIRTRDLTPPPILANRFVVKLNLFHFKFFNDFVSLTREHYIASAAWVSQTEVSVVWMNRPQNLSVVTVCKSPMWYCQETHRISGDGRGWIDEVSVPFFSSNSSSYIAISPLRDGLSGHYKHLVHIHISKKRIVPLTHGKFEVNKIVNWDEIHNYV